MKRLAAIALLLVLTGCSSPTSTTPESEAAAPGPAASSATPEEPAEDGRTEVVWEDYASYKTIIDEDEANKNCEGLQDSFDTLESSNSSYLETTGHGNTEIMGYILEAQMNAGCFE